MATPYGVSQPHHTTHHALQESSGRVINPTQRPLPDNTQHIRKSHAHPPTVEIRTRNPSKRGTQDPRLSGATAICD